MNKMIYHFSFLLLFKTIVVSVIPIEQKSKQGKMLTNLNSIDLNQFYSVHQSNDAHIQQHHLDNLCLFVSKDNAQVVEIDFAHLVEGIYQVEILNNENK